MVGNVCDTAVEEWEVGLDDISNHDLELGLEGGALHTLLKLGYHPWVNLTRYHLEERSIKMIKLFLGAVFYVKIMRIKNSKMRSICFG